MRHKEGFEGGKGNHFRHRKTQSIPKGEWWIKDDKDQLFSRRRLAMLWLKSYLLTGCRRSCLIPDVILLVCHAFWRQRKRSGWNVRATSSQQQINSSLEEDANNGSLQQTRRFCLKSLASSPFLKMCPEMNQGMVSPCVAWKVLQWNLVVLFGIPCLRAVYFN